MITLITLDPHNVAPSGLLTELELDIHTADRSLKKLN